MTDVFIINTLNSAIRMYIIITTFTFILRLFTTARILSIIIIITIIIIKINPPFSLSELWKLWLSL